MQREEWERGEIFIYLPMVDHFHLSFPLMKHQGVWQGLDETSRGRASSGGLDWTNAKVSPRPEIPAFCENTDIATFTVSSVATLVSRNLANGSRTMSQTLLLYSSELQTLPEHSPTLQLPEPLAPGLSPALLFALSKRNRLRRRNAFGAETGARALCADPDNLLHSFQGERKGFRTC